MIRLTFLVLLGSASALLAQDDPQGTAAEETAETAPLGADLTVPGVFFENRPQNLNDLRAMQGYQRVLAQGLRQATCTILLEPAAGSGEFISADGLIASAAHVTGPPGGKLRILLADGKSLEGIALSSDAEIDGSFAMILPGQLEQPLTWLELAPPGEQEIGDWCLAAGNSGGWDAVRGSVVRVGRLVRVEEDVIQSDTTLIGGDSGGPLVDIHGRLLGANSRVGMTARYSLHVPLEYFTTNIETARAQAEMVREQGVDAFLAHLADLADLAEQVDGEDAEDKSEAEHSEAELEPEVGPEAASASGQTPATPQG